MKRTLTMMAAAAVGVFAVSANALTSLTLVPSGTFMPGSLLTLTTIATSNGGETATGVIGNINYSNAALNAVGQPGGPAGPNTQVSLGTIGDALPGWSNGGLICTTAFCTAFNQTKALPAGTAGITAVPIAATFFNIDPTTPAGTVLNFVWRTTPTTQGLSWFGLTNTAGVSVTVVPIPEPTTAALLGLGLVGLAVAGRRRA